MLLENNLIKKINEILSSSKNEYTKTFEPDLEIIKFGSENLLIKINEFSEINLLRENDPYILGWNVAVAGLSNIIAAGGEPIHYGHSLTVSKKWDELYILNFITGISDVLKEYNIPFVAGNYKISGEWRCSITVIGTIKGQLLKRDSANIGDSIYISGYIGRGNVEAFLKNKYKHKGIERLSRTYKNRFRIRQDESRLINKFGTSCIDTSRGVLSSLNCIAELSNVGFRLENIPYVKSGMLAIKMLNIPKELLMAGICGEYELLFTVNKDNEGDFIKISEKNNMSFHKIGEIVEENIKELHEDGKITDFLEENKNQKRENSKFDDYKNIFKSIFKNN